MQDQRGKPSIPMDIVKVGKAIAYLRKRAGFTQKDLADRIGISDKAVSKWERGMGLPEIGYLRKLSILLDTDTDSLLAGDVVHHDSNWQGIILLGESRYGIGAKTIIYDKPLLYYLLSYFLLVGIRDISIIGTQEDKAYVDAKMGNGEAYGIKLTTVAGTLKEAIHRRQWAGSIMMVYGKCLLYGVDQTRFFQKAMLSQDRLTMMALPKKIAHESMRLNIDHNKRVINSDSDELLKTQYDFSDIPFLFFPSELIDEIAAEPSVAAFISRYASIQALYVHLLDRGFVDIEVDDWKSVQEASTFIRIVQERCGMNVYCIEEVAWRRGLISLERLKALGEGYGDTEYGNYILSLYGRVCESAQSS